MDSTGFLDRLTTDGALLARAARTADLAAPVPGLEWTVRDVVAHAGAVHRWCADLVARRLVGDETGGSASLPHRPARRRAGRLVRRGPDRPHDDAGRDPGGRRSSGGSAGRCRPGRSGRVARPTRPPCTGPTSRVVPAARSPPSVRTSRRTASTSSPASPEASGPQPGAPCHLALLASDGDDRLITFDGGRITSGPGRGHRPGAGDGGGHVVGPLPLGVEPAFGRRRGRRRRRDRPVAEGVHLVTGTDRPTTTRSPRW